MTARTLTGVSRYDRKNGRKEGREGGREGVAHTKDIPDRQPPAPVPRGEIPFFERTGPKRRALDAVLVFYGRERKRRRREGEAVKEEVRDM